MATAPVIRKLSREQRKAASIIDAFVGLQGEGENADVVVFTLRSLLDLFLARVPTPPALPALGDLADVDFPESTQLRFLGSNRQWVYIDIGAIGSGGGTGAAAAFSTLNGAPADNQALREALAAKLNVADALTIDDASLLSLVKTMSVTAIRRLINEAAARTKTETKNEILNGAGAAHDTLIELGILLEAGASLEASLTQAMGFRLRFDAPQSLTDAQKAQALANLGLSDLRDRILPPTTTGATGDIIYKGASKLPLWAAPPAAGTSGGTTTPPTDTDDYATDVAVMTASSNNMNTKTAAFKD